MKYISVLLIVTLSVLSCNNSPAPADTTAVPLVPAEPEKSSFFPVTDYLKGQIAEIRTNGINPKKMVTIKGKIDSSWLKVEELDAAFAPFLLPVIDSSSLAPFFTEKKFLDQTINAFTFTFDPVKPLPDSFLLKHLDIYVDPEKNTVRRIYLLKKTADHKTVQLTWQSDMWCRIVTIAADPKGKDFIEKEVTIKWDF